jgi:hypothetical protein
LPTMRMRPHVKQKEVERANTQNRRSCRRQLQWASSTTTQGNGGRCSDAGGSSEQRRQQQQRCEQRRVGQGLSGGGGEFSWGCALANSCLLCLSSRAWPVARDARRRAPPSWRRFLPFLLREAPFIHRLRGSAWRPQSPKSHSCCRMNQKREQHQ